MNGVHDMGGLQDMGPIPYEKDEPVFHEPWEGRVFALNRALGAFRKWRAAALADELKAAEKRGEPDDGSHYYEHWLSALERLVVEKGLTDPEAMLQRKDAWTEAYLHTPHGKPVELDRREHNHS
jgi:nitrile hydratase accessory protein